MVRGRCSTALREKAASQDDPSELDFSQSVLIFDGQLEFVPHERDVALDRFALHAK